MGIVIVSGLPSEAISQEAGIPFSLAIFSSDMARTSDEMAIIAKAKNDVQAEMRAMEQIRRFRILFCCFFVGILLTLS